MGGIDGRFAGIPLFFWYTIFAFTLLIIALVSIPRRHVKVLFMESLFWGYFVSLVMSVVKIALGLYHYQHMGPFHILGSPIWLDLGWAPAVMMFVYFKPPIRQSFLFWSYLVAFCSLSADLDAVLHQLGVLVYIHWSPVARFFTVFVWLLVVAALDERYMEPRRRELAVVS